MMKNLNKKWLLRILAVIIIMILAGLLARQFLGKDKNLDTIASGNGRIEATEIDVAARSSGRIKDILVDEGDFVKAGQVLAHIDSDSLNAQLRQAEAQAQQAHNAILTARSQLAQRQAERAAVLAMVVQREAERAAARSAQGRQRDAIPGDERPRIGFRRDIDLRVMDHGDPAAMRERTKIAQIQQDIPARAPGQFDLFPPDPGQLARRGGFKVLEARDTRRLRAA